MDRSELPIGFSMALAMNPDAMQKFASLSEEQQKEIIEGTHNIKSKDEMHRYVSNIVANKTDTRV